MENVVACAPTIDMTIDIVFVSEQLGQLFERTASELATSLVHDTQWLDHVIYNFLAMDQDTHQWRMALNLFTSRAPFAHEVVELIRHLYALYGKMFRYMNVYYFYSLYRTTTGVFRYRAHDTVVQWLAYVYNMDNIQRQVTRPMPHAPYESYQLISIWHELCSLGQPNVAMTLDVNTGKVISSHPDCRNYSKEALDNSTVFDQAEVTF